jgi:hypothetical protein
MVVFALITMGLYLSAWFFARRGPFADLSPKAKNARQLFAGLLGVHIFYLLAWLGYLGSPDAELLSAIELLWWGFMGVMFYSAFVARSALAEFSAARGAKFAGSTLWALFLNAFYLQSQINGMIDARLLAVSP